MKNAEEMAEIISEIYEKTFGGKKRGRYQISRSLFTELSGRIRLRESFVYNVIDHALDLGYIVIDLGNNLIVIEASITENYRKVPKSIVKEIISEYQELEEDDEDILD